MLRVSASSLFDLQEISLCHHACFPDSFSTKIGLAFTRKTFEWFLVGNNRFLFKANIDDKIAGYLGGLCPQYIGDGSTSGMMRYAMKHAVAGIIKKPGLLFHKEIVPFYPLILKNIYREILKVQVNRTSSFNSLNSDGFEKKVGLVVVGVHPDYRGKNIFQSLMCQFEKEAKARDISKLVLSVKKENIIGVKAYHKAGWTLEREKNKVLEMCKNI